jgi:hypothetical protein
MSNTTKIMVDARKFAESIDIFNAIEEAGIIHDIRTMDVTNTEAVIVGKNLERLKFILTGMGYELSLGPKKTHLFVSMKEKK